MLCWLKGICCWHRKAEGAHPPSVSLPLRNFVVISHDLFIQTIELVEHGRSLFWGERSTAQLLAVVGSFSLDMAT